LWRTLIGLGEARAASAILPSYSDHQVVLHLNAGEICNREVVVGYRDMTLPEAARLMRECHVGSLVIVVDRLTERIPVGILTDRDFTVAVLAKDLDPRGLDVAEVMSADPFTVSEEDSVTDVLRLMRERGVRRLPVLTHSGALAGIVTIDDILDIVAEQLGEVVHAIKRERARETHVRS
jgi:CBS domain-containing protein